MDACYHHVLVDGANHTTIDGSDMGALTHELNRRNGKWTQPMDFGIKSCTIRMTDSACT